MANHLDVADITLADDGLLPSQWIDRLRGTSRTPEQRLLLAILADVIQLLRGPTGMRVRVHARQEALAWVRGDGEPNPHKLSFADVCEGLGIDAQLLRERLSAAAVGPVARRSGDASAGGHIRMTLPRVRASRARG